MKIERKLILSNIMYGVFIILIGLFAFQNMNLLLTKLRFVEIADDLNASFLEMRLAEKNYFLYHQKKTLVEILADIETTERTINGVRGDIIKAIGETEFRRLKSLLGAYADVVKETGGRNIRDARDEVRLRAAGRRLKEFSDSVTHLERKRVNDIIHDSQRILILSFWAILFIALFLGRFISQKILRSLREILKLTRSISEGNFNKIEGFRTNDELGSVITAINSMSEELAYREEQIVQSRKLASLGVLTAGVAHEITNPLNNISMIAQTYDEVYHRLGEQERISLMRQVDAETGRIREIVKNLLDFSRPKDARPHEADINAVVRKSLMLVQNMIDVSGIETSVHLDDSLPPVFIDEHQMQQVLVNLFTNAVQAMSAGGRLAVSSRSRNNGGAVEIGVSDTGKGIPPEFVPHIFDPFFSTKGDSGTGLGLSVSYGIIKNHKGEIRVESKVGVGTTFTVELPALIKTEEHDDRDGVGAKEATETNG